MQELPQGDWLLAFSDTAGANACLSLAYILSQQKKNKITLYTNNTGFQKNQWNLPVTVVNAVDFATVKKPDFVFTGTSHPDTSKGFELKFIQWTKKEGIHSISFIDHWVNYRLRFLQNNELVVPDEIWVLDKTAKEEAIKEGLPADVLKINTNPYHEYLKLFWHSGYEKKLYLDQQGFVTKDHKVILFAPDPISLRNKKDENNFDEGVALQILIDALKKIKTKEKILLVVKPHPLQPKNLLEKIINENRSAGITIAVAKNLNPLELINASDVVIGFYSNFLVEAMVLNKPVVRYLPDNFLDLLESMKEQLPVVNTSNLFLTLEEMFKKHE